MGKNCVNAYSRASVLVRNSIPSLVSMFLCITFCSFVPLWIFFVCARLRVNLGDFLFATVFHTYALKKLMLVMEKLGFDPSANRVNAAG